MNQNRTARCISCRAEVPVPDSYEEGSQVGCPSCAVQLKIVRKGGLRLVIADVLALQDRLRETKTLIAEASRDLQRAKASWGIGVNGLGLGVLYVVARVALDERTLDRKLVLEAVVLALVVGGLLEAANYLFLAKRRAITDLTKQLQGAIADQKELQRKIRESSRR
ncbi:MAG: hypothetical protein KA385_10450 [Vicinamibacteria bacterium]|nr:hypothetical protein [Vicinamibacteria bacterium]